MTKRSGRWRKRETEEKRIQVSRRRRAREENSRGHKSRDGGVGRWKEGFTGRWKRAAGEWGELGGAAITGVVEGEEHRWRQETGRPEGGWRKGGREGERVYGRLQTRGATCFMTSVHHIAPAS